MTQNFNRRDFMKTAGSTLGSVAAVAALGTTGANLAFGAKKQPLFNISLAQWSFHRSLGRGGKKVMDNLDFAKESKKLGIHAIEYVNQFFKDKANDEKYLAEMKKRADGEGVKSLLIMCDGEGRLGDPDPKKRTQAVENHYKWVTAAKFLGCHSIRVNAASAGSWEEQVKLAADGLSRLTEFSSKHGLYTIVENHGGLSSNGKWLAEVMKTVGNQKCGTLPDFGNFHLGGGKWYDRYQGVKELMPYAKAVSAKSHAFDDKGNETKTDFRKIMKIVLDASPTDWVANGKYVGIEWEGGSIPEPKGIVATRKLLETVREEMSA